MDTIQVVIMGLDEARLLVQRIRDGLNTIADDLWELKDREGWRSLGYWSWRECATKEFGFSQARVYQLLAHAEVVKNITANSTIGGKTILPENERQTRPLADLPPTDQPAAWTATQQRTGLVQPPAREVAETVREIRSIPKSYSTRPTPKLKSPSMAGFNQSVTSDDFNQDTSQNSKSLEEQAAIGLLELIGYSVIPPEAAEQDTCAYCGKPFK